MTHTQRRRTRLRPTGIAALALAAWLSGCGSAPGIAISTDVSTIDIVRGTSAELSLTLTRTGEAAADVQLTTVGLPDHVDASLSNETLTGPTLQSTLTLTVDAQAAEGSYDVKVLAVGSGLSSEAEVELTVSSLEVTGTVFRSPGRPWSGIAIDGPGGSTATAADGTFTLHGLAVPYDLTVYNDVGSGSVHVFEGLTSAAPELHPIEPSFAALVADNANLAGTLSGSSMPLAVNHEARVCLEGVNDSVFNACQMLGAGEDSYDLSIFWVGPGALSARLHILAYELNGAGDAPSAYVGYASADVELSDGDVTPLNVVLSDVPATTTLTGEVVVVGGGSPDRVYAGVRFGPNLTMPLFGDGSGAETFAMPMPVLPGGSFDVVAVSGSPERLAWKAGSGAEAGTLLIPAAVTLVAPDDAVGGVDTTTPFEVDSPEPAVITYVWDGGIGAPWYALTTNGTTVRVPDVSALASALPANAPYDWWALRTPENVVDDAARIDYDHALDALYMMGTMLGGRGLFAEGAFASSSQRTFTTAP